VALFALPVADSAPVLLRGWTWRSRIAWATAMSVCASIAAGLLFFAWRTWHYTGVFSLFYGTSRQFQSVWQPGMSLPSYVRAMADSVSAVLTMNDPPALDLHALPIVVGASASLLALTGVPGLRTLPFAPALFCLAGIAGALVARASAYPGRFSIHLIGVTSAMSVCLVAALCRMRSTRSTSSSS